MNEFNHLNRKVTTTTRTNGKAKNKNTGAKTTLAVTFMLLVGALILGGGLALGLAGCGDNTSNSGTTNSSPNSASTTTLISPASSGSGSGNADPYQNLDPQQVMDTYLKAYQAGDWPKCLALISPSVKAGWTSPDELSLKAAQAQSEGGKLVVDRYGPIQGSPDNFLVIYHRELPAGAPTVTPMKSLGGGTIGPERNATAQAFYLTAHASSNSGNFEVSRVGNAYKITAYTIL